MKKLTRIASNKWAIENITGGGSCSTHRIKRDKRRKKPFALFVCGPTELGRRLVGYFDTMSQEGGLNDGLEKN